MKRIPIIALATYLTIALCNGQEFTNAGWFISPDRPTEHRSMPRTAEVQSTNAETLLTPLISPPEIAEAITPEIQALAQGLQNDPKRIFDYVHDHIRYVHYFGSKKGAALTLLERSGNDFDQCALLVALLRAAGLSPSYRFGLVYMPYENTSTHQDFKHWLGLTKEETNLTEVLNFSISLNRYRGFPYEDAFFDGTDDLILHRVWVRLTWNGYTYSLDPAFKINEPITGIDLHAAPQIDTNELMTAAGGTVTTNYVMNVDEVTLTNKLGKYTTNLLAYIRSNSPNASVDDILGGQYILSSKNSLLSQDLPFTVISGYSMDWTDIPTDYMTTLNIAFAGTNQFLWMPQLQGQRLSLTFNSNGLAQLWVDDSELLETQMSGGRTVDLTMTVDHPHGYWDFTNNVLVNTNWDDQTATASYQCTNANYAILYAFEPHKDWLRERQARLDSYRQQTNDTSRQVICETLNEMGLSWMLQTELLAGTLCAQQQLLLQYHHRLGRMAQELGSGYYVDVYEQLNGVYPASGKGTNDVARSNREFEVEAYFSSATESGIIEQLQSQGVQAASTVKMLRISNAMGAVGQATYFANSTNWAAVRPSLAAYDAGYLDELKTNFIDQGVSLLIPSYGLNGVPGGTWEGFGIAARGSVTNSGTVYEFMQMLIKGNYHGGYAAANWAATDPAFISLANNLQPAYLNLVPAYILPPTGADPVNMADGSFQISATDLSLGGPEPRGFAFRRSYSSNWRYQNLAGLGNGWVHNYYLKATDVSAPSAGLGDTTPAQMASTIVATRAAFELYNPAGAAKNWLVTALIAKWALDEILHNAVSVSLGKDTLQFILRPDGTYTPPAGSTMTLLKTNGVYWLQQRHGNTFKFNESGLATNITDQYNRKLNFKYTNGLVTKITDWKSRTLTFSYSGSPSRLKSIADSPGRSVFFGYATNAGQIDLAWVSDPEHQTNSYTCDTNHQITSSIDALRQLVVSNVYNTQGQVVTQYSQGLASNAWVLSYSGFDSFQQDPVGGITQYSFDEKHRQIAVFDALTNLTQTVYDGQDHVVQSISPLSETNIAVFDADHNCIQTIDALNNTNFSFFDSKNNCYLTIDANGNQSHFGYNAQFSLTGSTNGQGDWRTWSYNSDGTLDSQSEHLYTTSFGYNANGFLKLITYAGDLGSEGFLNNPFGDVLSHTNVAGFVVSFQYNNRRQVTNTIAPTNLTTKVMLDAVGNTIATTDGRNYTVSNTWSPTRKLLTTTLPATAAGRAVLGNAYDSRDWLIRSTNGSGKVTIIGNDPVGRQISQTDPLQRTTSMGRDSDGRVISMTNAAFEVTQQFLNSRGEVALIATPSSITIGHSNDPAGNQIFLTNRNGKVWQFVPDAANRITNVISPLRRTNSVVFNDRGLPWILRQPSGNSATNSYDGLRRLIGHGDSYATTIYYYDTNGILTRIKQATTNFVFGPVLAILRDAYGLMSFCTNADGYIVHYQHDPSGNLTVLTYPGGLSVTNSYNALNQLTNVTDWLGNQTFIDYDLAGNITKITRPNGSLRIINRDAAGQITNIVEKFANNAPIAFFRDNWDAASRVQWEFTGPPPHPYSLPANSMTYDDDNRLATFNGQTVTNDLDGNMTWGPGTNSDFINYSFNVRNQLVGTAFPSGPQITYGYGPAGNRNSITNGTDVTRFVIDMNASLPRIVMRIKAGTTNYYIHGAGLLYEITLTAASTNIHYYHFDLRGSTVALSDQNGNVTDRAEYSAYGTMTYRQGSTDTPFWFNGRFGVQTDPNGLLYMRARYYNPFICRFINADPSGFQGGLNLYAAFNGNPVSLLDPFGLGAEPSLSDRIGSWVDSHLADPLFNGMQEHEDRYDYLMYQMSGTPDWMTPINAVSAGVNLAAQDLGMAVAWTEDKLSLQQGDLAMLPMLAPELQGLAAVDSSAMAGAARNVGRFFYDDRPFTTISRQYWRANGPASGSSLHHWFFPQSATWVPQGLRNAGFNLLELPPVINTPFGGLNQWMGMSGSAWAPLADWGIRLGIPSAFGAAAYGGFQLGNAASGTESNQ